ncbi:MAG: proline dehydrogenase family protein [Gemmatimonadales bacterium]|nr:proline dehydrogenase family protein [Gemmatimonadales bacterium]MDZ4391015.1 proline dehydrogenase family protein [Gemmatimonadales bacterium]
MMRSFLLWLSERQSIFNFVRRNRVAKHFASRFVAGESVTTALEAARELKARGITASLDLLGESVRQPAESEQARDMYVAILSGMHESGIEVNASVKLTQMGLDIDEALCERNMRAILDVARETGAFVRLDMEGSDYTDRTLDFFEQRLFPDYGGHVGVVLQSALKRTTKDAERMIALGARVRLCKGAYLEPPDIAYADKADVDAHYLRLMEALVSRGNYPGIATHDEAMIAATRAFVAREGIAPDRFEFQMLYGVRRDLQDQLVADGFRMRVYIPFGTQWYPYLMRRLAERPANIAFILGNILKEGTRRS